MVERSGRIRPGRHEPEIGVVDVAAFDLAQPIHHPETLERVLAVEHAAVVHLTQIPFDEAAGEGGAAEQNRDVRQATVVELRQVVAHDQGAT